MQFTRSFHSTHSLFALQNHKLYPKVDWERVDAGQYAVVDPVNPGVILYLSEQDYIVMVRVAITSNKTLKVLASPGETPATSSQPDPSQNSPSQSPWETILKLGKRTSEGQRGRTRFLNLFRSVLQPYFSKVKATQSTKVGVQGISMIGLTRENVVEWFCSWHDLVSWRSRGSLLTTAQQNERKSFGVYLSVILKNNGINHLIARLKVMLFVVNAYLGGRRLTSTQSLGFRVKLQNGLPAALPLMVRQGIRYGNKHYVHIWTSMLFSYKGILGTWSEPRLDQSSITAPHPNILETPAFKGFEYFARYFWALLFSLGARKPNFKIKGTFFSTHAGPNHPNTVLGAGIDAFLWEALDRFGFKKDPRLATADVCEATQILGPDSWKLFAIREVTGVSRNYIREWLESTGQGDLWQRIRRTAKMFALNNAVLRSVKDDNNLFTILTAEGEKPAFSNNYLYRYFGLNTRLNKFSRPSLQRLHNLYEAAGKVRTIAIVDYWTNFVLKPLHDWMFDILQMLPQDATFDQEGRVREFAQRGYSHVYSYDLKSATDLIPLALYRALFNEIFGTKLTDLWFDLLVSRDFLVPKSTLKAFPSHPKRIRYSTGQPMGALTSWASMALVHHALVLYAAFCAKVITLDNILSFKDYMVLGDDIVIANAAVAEQYVLIMKELNVPLSLAKSHISELGMFNFANQTFVKGVNVSPLSLREEINATSLPQRIELSLRLARRGWIDLKSRTWVTPLVKSMIGPDIWFHLQTDIRRRVVPPLIRWILATLLTPGTTRIGFAGLPSVSLEICLGAMLRKAELWGFRVTKFGSIFQTRSAGLLVSILGKWVNTVYAEFLRSRKRLEEFPNWVNRVISIDLEWLFLRIFEEAKAEALSRWTSKYRRPLKAIQVCANLSNFTIHDIEIGTGMAWEDIVPFIAQAEADLPVVPDFSQESLEVLTGLKTGGQKSDYLTLRESFMRVTNVLGMIDHLSTSGAPGFNSAWDISQSSREDSSPDK